METDNQVKLSRRETETLVACRDESTSLKAAKKLGISKRTVDFHLANIYAKLRVDTKKDAIMKAEDLKLIPARTKVW